MNKEEIEAKLHNCEERLKDIAKAIKEFREHLVEAEKLEKLDKLLEEPKHGDYGMNMLFPRIVINGAVYNASGECIRNVDDGAIGKNCAEIWFGNVFDLMKDWDKDLDRATIDGFVIEICGNRIVIGGRRFLIDRAEEFWHKLGRMIMTRKRNQ